MSTNAQVRIPRVLEEVTADWLSNALASFVPGVTVDAVRLDPPMGFKPNKARAHLVYGGSRRADLPETLIVKGGFKGLGAEATGLDIGVELEVLAYRDLVPVLDAITPRCYFIDWDPQSYDGILLLEDLASQGATFLNTAQSLSVGQATAFVEAQARLHARWWDSNAFRTGGEFGPQSPLGERNARLHLLYLDKLVSPDYWDKFIRLPRGAALPRSLQDAARMSAALARMHELHRGVPQCFVHGDEHLGNLYLDAAGRPGFIDWIGRNEPWVIGYVYFILSTLDCLDRRNWERPLLAHYLDSLQRLGVVAPDFESAWFLYRCSTIYPLLTWLNNSGKWQPEAVNTRNTLRAALAVIDHDAFSLLGV